ncbi:MAG: twin-arginine translocase subunit TatC [Burkholderiaceae bacterium]|nr:twin-arginine translocase subunit TatC [Sulfuritalea sp.]MCF8174495.1 twin-arginine translocase subunit TatC [Burkholderiaceae bacterium]MCF8183453.1 twin-arginine translocase subunit TatC [Polynucleobacter sp.]
MAEEQETFLSHLVELRDRLIRVLIMVGLAFIPLAFFARELYSLLAAPLLAVLPAGGQMIATDVVGVFLVPMKVALTVAFLVVLPFVLYQVWAFVAPGLYVHEKKLALPLLAASVILFFVGMAFAYFAFFPMVFGFMSKFAPEGVAWMTDIEKYFSFVLTMFMAFGVTFEVPVIVIVLVKIGVVEVAKLREIRPYVIVGAFVIGAIFTPPDVISQFMLAMPMWLLYEAGIILASMIVKSPPKEAGASDYRPPSDEEMDRELDRAEQHSGEQKT